MNIQRQQTDAKKIKLEAEFIEFQNPEAEDKNGHDSIIYHD